MKNVRAYLRKDGRWEARLPMGKRTDGKRLFKSFYGSSKDEAEQKLMHATEVYDREYAVTDLTVKEVVDEWFSAVSVRIKESTAANYRMKIEKHIIPYFDGMFCRDLAVRSGQRFADDKIRSGLSPRYVSDILIILKAAFRYAQREYNIKNVFDGIVMPKIEKSDTKLLSADNVKRLIAYVLDNKNLNSVGVLLALLMGMRIGEVCGLRWVDIDFIKRTLTVRRTVQRIQIHGSSRKTKVFVGSPKSASSKREIPIPNELYKILKMIRSDGEHYILSDSVKPVEPRTMENRFAVILKNAGLPSVKFHSLRHMFATTAIEHGSDTKTVSEVLGHSSVKTTMDRYVHPSLERKRRCMDMICWSA